MDNLTDEELEIQRKADYMPYDIQVLLSTISSLRAELVQRSDDMTTAYMVGASKAKDEWAKERDLLLKEVGILKYACAEGIKISFMWTKTSDILQAALDETDALARQREGK